VKVNRIVSLLIMVGLAVGLGVWRMRARQDRDPRRPTQKNSSVPSAPALDPAALDAPPPAAGQTGDGVARLSGQPAGTLGLSLENEVHAALQRGLDWLAERQRDDGSWSNPNFPAITALATEAFIRSRHPRKDEVVRKGIAFILSCARDDGGIYRPVEGRKGGGLGNYNTAICMTTLHAAGNPELTPYVLNARTYIAGSQHFGDDVYKGGFGYDRQTDRAYADLLNTYYAAVAMRETADAEEARPAGEKRVDIDWSQTVKFVERMQNRPEAGKESYGGFFYKPGESKAGTTTNETGTVYFRSYGSMTYAGLLALIYADVDRGVIAGENPFTYDGPDPDHYVQEMANLIQSIRDGSPINEGKQVAESTMNAIMGRMSAYSGRALKWDWAMKASKLDLRPPKYDWIDLPVRPVAIPGKTPLV